MKRPRILIYDVETSPVLAWIWRTGYKLNIDHSQILKGQKFDIICICYKWLGEKKVYTLKWDGKQNSAEMIEAFTKVIESADLAVAHNGDAFDQKQINTQRLLHNQKPIAWPSTEDTLKQLRRTFAMPSYKLDYIAKLLTGSGKDPMCFQDWIDIVQHNSSKALKKMIKYCRKDVLKLESVFKRVSPYLRPKVHVGLIKHESQVGCPRCGSEEAVKHGVAKTLSAIYQRFQCKSCHTVFRGKKSLIVKAR